MKTCPRCGESKDPSLFGIDKSRKDGRYPYCRSCVTKQSREQRKSPTYRAEYNTWRDSRKSSPRSRASRLLGYARERSNVVTIDSDWIRERIEAGHCAVTGLPFDLSQVGRPPAPLTPSLDQIRPGEGYTPENTQVVVWIYNRAKGADTHEAVMQLADALCRK